MSLSESLNTELDKCIKLRCAHNPADSIQIGFENAIVVCTHAMRDSAAPESPAVVHLAAIDAITAGQHLIWLGIYESSRGTPQKRKEIADDAALKIAQATLLANIPLIRNTPHNCTIPTTSKDRMQKAAKRILNENASSRSISEWHEGLCFGLQAALISGADVESTFIDANMAPNADNTDILVTSAHYTFSRITNEPIED